MCTACPRNLFDLIQSIIIITVGHRSFTEQSPSILPHGLTRWPLVLLIIVVQIIERLKGKQSKGQEKSTERESRLGMNNEDTNTGTTNNFSIDSEDEDSNCNVCCYSSRIFLFL